MRSEAIWHDVECGGYGADLETWERLANAAAGPILELGAGSGRVALHLASRGHRVWAVDSNPLLLEALEEVSGGLPVERVCADVKGLSLEETFGLVIAPMQVMQMLGGEAGRLAALRSAAGHLTAGGVFAAAVVELPARLDGAAAASALPDVRERDGWLYSSLPVVVPGTGGIEIRRLRQAVSPEGELSEEQASEYLDALDPETLEAEGAAAGLRAVERLEIPAEDGYLGSTVVVLERP